LSIIVFRSRLGANYAPSIDSVLADHRTSPAYRALYLHLEDVSNQLKQLQTRYANSYSSVATKKFEYDLTKLEMAKILVKRESEVSFLTTDYGNLLVRKIKTETELREMLTGLTLTHPNVTLKSSQLQAIEKEIILYISK
jgi:hypothetical protein